MSLALLPCEAVGRRITLQALAVQAGETTEGAQWLDDVAEAIDAVLSAARAGDDVTELAKCAAPNRFQSGQLEDLDC